MRVTAALDPDDNIFLECAETAEANFLVTGNIRHFPDSWREKGIDATAVYGSQRPASDESDWSN
jgi:hypothetical protein